MPVSARFWILGMGLILAIHCDAQTRRNIPPPFSALVIKIVDGDTYDVLTADRQTIRIRMNGIDAPEKKQAFGQKAKDQLAALCFRQTVRVEPLSYDRNGRLIADAINPQGLHLSLEMVKRGYAWHFKKYSSDPVLANAEINARRQRLGLWADPNPMPPWTYRAMRRK